MFQKWQLLDTNHGLTPLERCQFFDFLNSFFFQPRRAFFRSTISQNTFSFSILPKNKKFEKWPFLDQNHGLTPLPKCQFFDFLNFLFFQPKRAFFRSRISYNTFSLSILPKKKKLGKWPFLDQNQELTPLGKCQFFDFLNFFFFILERRFFVPEYHTIHFRGLNSVKKKG